MCKQKFLLGRSNFNIFIKVFKGDKIKRFEFLVPNTSFTVFDREDSYLLFPIMLTILLMLNKFGQSEHLL